MKRINLFRGIILFLLGFLLSISLIASLGRAQTTASGIQLNNENFKMNYVVGGGSSGSLNDPCIAPPTSGNKIMLPGTSIDSSTWNGNTLTTVADKHFQVTTEFYCMYTADDVYSGYIFNSHINFKLGTFYPETSTVFGLYYLNSNIFEEDAIYGAFTSLGTNIGQGFEGTLYPVPQILSFDGTDVYGSKTIDGQTYSFSTSGALHPMIKDVSIIDVSDPQTVFPYVDHFISDTAKTSAAFTMTVTKPSLLLGNIAGTSDTTEIAYLKADADSQGNPNYHYDNSPEYGGQQGAAGGMAKADDVDLSGFHLTLRPDIGVALQAMAYKNYGDANIVTDCGGGDPVGTFDNPSQSYSSPSTTGIFYRPIGWHVTNELVNVTFDVDVQLTANVNIINIADHSVPLSLPVGKLDDVYWTLLNPTNDSNLPLTDNSSLIWQWILLIVISIGCIAGMYLVLKLVIFKKSLDKGKK